MHEQPPAFHDPLAPVLAVLMAAPPVATAARHLEAVAQAGRAQGWAVLPLGQQPATEATELAQWHAAIALQSLRHGRPLAPTLLLSAGSVLHQGKAAGPAQFLLALALSVDEHPAVHAAAHGPEPTSGQTALALLRPDTLARARARRIDPGRALRSGAGNDLLDALGDVQGRVPDGACADVLRAVLITLD